MRVRQVGSFGRVETSNEGKLTVAVHTKQALAQSVSKHGNMLNLILRPYAFIWYALYKILTEA